MLKKIKTFLKVRKRSDTSEVLVGGAWSSEDLFYPPTPKGFPYVPIDVLLDAHKEILGKARIQMGLGVNFDAFLLPIIKRYAQFVHLLPASESHHHRRMSGLLAHGLEVATLSAQFALAKVFPLDGPPRFKRAHEQRWIAAAFLAGLCHDIGKPISDMQITNKDGSKIWDPLRSSLVQWLENEGLDRYYLNWRSDRIHKNHERYTNLIWQKIISYEDISFLKEYDPSCMDAFLDAMGLQSKGVLSKLTMRADMASVARDLKEHKMSPEQMHFYGVPIERYVFDALRVLVQSNQLNVNDPENGFVFHLSSGAYVLWNEIAHLISNQLDKSEIPGIPRDANILASLFIERGYAKERAIINEDGESKQYIYWPIKKLVNKGGLAAQIDGLALRFEDPKWVFTEVLPPITDKVILADDVNQIKAVTPLEDHSDVAIANDKAVPETADRNSLLVLNEPTKKLSDTSETEIDTQQDGDALIPENVKNSRVKQIINEAREAHTKRQVSSSSSLIENNNILLRPSADLKLSATGGDKSNEDPNEGEVEQSLDQVMSALMKREPKPAPLAMPVKQVANEADCATDKAKNSHVTNEQNSLGNNNSSDQKMNSREVAANEVTDKQPLLVLSKGLNLSGTTLSKSVLLGDSKTELLGKARTNGTNLDEINLRGSNLIPGASIADTRPNKKKKSKKGKSKPRLKRPQHNVSSQTMSADLAASEVQQKDLCQHVICGDPESLESYLKSFGNESLAIMSAWTEIISGDARIGHKLDIREKKFCLTKNAFESDTQYDEWVNAASANHLIDQTQSEQIKDGWDTRAVVLNHQLQVLLGERLSQIETGDDPFLVPTKAVIKQSVSVDAETRKLNGADRPAVKEKIVAKDKERIINHYLQALAKQMLNGAGKYLVGISQNQNSVSVIADKSLLLIAQDMDASISYNDLMIGCFTNTSLGLKVRGDRIFLQI